MYVAFEKKVTWAVDDLIRLSTAPPRAFSFCFETLVVIDTSTSVVGVGFFLSAGICRRRTESLRASAVSPVAGDQPDWPVHRRRVLSVPGESMVRVLLYLHVGFFFLRRINHRGGGRFIPPTHRVLEWWVVSFFWCSRWQVYEKSPS
jgi:hypothetical protein